MKIVDSSVFIEDCIISQNEKSGFHISGPRSRLYMNHCDIRANLLGTFAFDKISSNSNMNSDSNLLTFNKSSCIDNHDLGSIDIDCDVSNDNNNNNSNDNNNNNNNTTNGNNSNIDSNSNHDNENYCNHSQDDNLTIKSNTNISIESNSLNKQIAKYQSLDYEIFQEKDANLEFNSHCKNNNENENKNDNENENRNENENKNVAKS